MLKYVLGYEGGCVSVVTCVQWTLMALSEDASVPASFPVGLKRKKIFNVRFYFETWYYTGNFP